MLSKPFLQYIRLLFFFYDYFFLKWIKYPIQKFDNKKQVLIVFPLSLGDCIIFLGSVPYIRKVYPPDKFSITLACQKEYETLFEDYFDHILAVDYRRACIDPIYRIRFCKIFRKKYFDIAVDPVGSEECSPNIFVMNAVCAAEKIGTIYLSNKKLQCPQWMRNRIYTKIIYNSIKNLHKTKYYTYFWSALGKEEFVPRLAEFSYKYEKQLPERYVVIFPSASTEVKQWPVKRFAEITRRICKKDRYSLVLCGTDKDRKVTDEMLRSIDNTITCYDLVGKTSVREFIGIIGQAELVITNDTSTYHIAVAQKRKVCVITGGYAYDSFINYRCGEYGYPEPAIVCRREDCINCYNRCIYKVDSIYPCVEKNTVEDVWKGIQRLMNENQDE